MIANSSRVFRVHYLTTHTKKNLTAIILECRWNQVSLFVVVREVRLAKTRLKLLYLEWWRKFVVLLDGGAIMSVFYIAYKASLPCVLTFLAYD